MSKPHTDPELRRPQHRKPRVVSDIPEAELLRLVHPSGRIHTIRRSFGAVIDALLEQGWTVEPGQRR